MLLKNFKQNFIRKWFTKQNANSELRNSLSGLVVLVVILQSANVGKYNVKKQVDYSDIT